jgi:hypothetical protein
MALVLLLGTFAMMPITLMASDSIEEIFDRAEPEYNAGELIDVLEYLRGNRMLINSVSEEELVELPLLSPLEAATIIDWRRLHGAIESIDTLDVIIGEERSRRLAPYVSFEIPRAALKQKAQKVIEGSMTGRLSWESPPRTGIENGKYTGGNRHGYSRVQAGSPHYGISILQESDTGERDFGDFISCSAFVQNVGILNQAVFGNYRLSFGQGLLLGQGRFFTKGTDAVDGVLLFSPALRPYTSAGESGFLQGAAASVSTGSFDVTLFSSSEKLDANISDGVVTSISDSGYHRTVTEISRKDNLEEMVNGINLRYRYRSDDLSAGIGATLLDWRYSYPLEWIGDGRYGSSNSAVEANIVYRQVQIFSEAAFSRDPDSISWIVGAQTDLAKGVTGVVSLRQYGLDYFSPFAGAFAEKGGGGSNEEGYYIGLRARVFPNFLIASSYDIFRFPELDRDDYPLPSSGHDARLYITWKQNRSMTWDGLYQHKEKEETLTQTDSGETVRYVMPVPRTTNRVQLTLRSRITPQFDLKTGSAYKCVQSHCIECIQSEQGWLLYQQFNYRIAKLTLKSRVAMFNTDSFDAALYAYEDDLPLVYTLNSYYGRGKAFFILLDYEPVRDCNLTAKYEITWYGDREVYSSGNDLRVTSSPGSFHMGVMWKF